MTVTTRHIRHDWTGWIDWQENVQKSVKTMCGVKSKPHLCGIPGVTQQDKIVYKNGKPVWGWCTRCVYETWPYLSPPALSPHIAPEQILDLHVQAQRELVLEYFRLVRGDYRNAVELGQGEPVNAYLETLHSLKDDFRLELAGEQLPI